MKIEDFISYEQPNNYIVQSDQYVENGKTPVLTAGQSFILGYTDEEDGIFTDGPVVIFDDFTTSVQYVDFPFKVKSSAMKILKNRENADIKYCYHLLSWLNKMPPNHKRQWISTTSQIDINLPSMSEQEDIVNKLEIISNIIKKRQEEIDKLDILIKARFVEMFGDSATNPKGYPVKVLSEIAEYWNGLTYKPEDVSDDGTIVLRSSNIQNASLDFEDTVRVSCKIGDRKYVKDNDILMCSRNGSARLVGKVALIKNIVEPMSFGAFMMIIRSDYYQYLMTYFQMNAFRAQITTGATTTINQITGRMLDNVKLPVPGLNEVVEFSAFCKQLDKLKVAVQKSLNGTRILFDSLMQEYFG